MFEADAWAQKQPFLIHVKRPHQSRHKESALPGSPTFITNVEGLRCVSQCV
jgi:hypothetical protein